MIGITDPHDKLTFDYIFKDGPLEYNKFFIDEKNRINWQNVKLFIYELVKNEKDFLMKEYMHRDQYYKNKLQQKKMDEEERVNNLPLFYRTEEMYICPQQEDWENRIDHVYMN